MTEQARQAGGEWHRAYFDGLAWCCRCTDDWHSADYFATPEVLNDLTAAAQQAEGLKAALQRIIDRDTLAWPYYQEKWGKPVGDGLHENAAIAAAALAALEVKDGN